MPSLSGPRLAPLNGPASHLVVLVHGYGSDGEDLIGLAEHWQDEMQGAAFIAPNGPDPLPGSPGYQWFPISRIDPAEMLKGVERVGPMLDRFLDEELARLQLPPEKLMLVGIQPGRHAVAASGIAPANAAGRDCGAFGSLAGRAAGIACAAAGISGAWRRRSGGAGAGHADGGHHPGRIRCAGAVAPGPWCRTWRGPPDHKAGGRISGPGGAWSTGCQRSGFHIFIRPGVMRLSQGAGIIGLFASCPAEPILAGARNRHYYRRA